MLKKNDKLKAPEKHNTEKQKGDWQIFVAIGAMLLGIVMTLQFRTQAQAGFPMFSQRSDMIKMVHELETQRNKLEAELADKKRSLEEFERSAVNGGEMATAIRNQLESVRTEAGYTDVSGPGIIVEMADSPKRPAPKDDPFYFIVHDVDLSTLVNELWASGAEAIAINDQRIVTTTSIRCVGPTVLVNSVRMASPYKVSAIGPAKDMDGALRTPGGFMDYMTPATMQGVKVKISSFDKLVLPSFKGSMILRYARTPEKQQ